MATAAYSHPCFLLTYWRTLVYFDAAEQALRHGDPRTAPRNVLLAQAADGRFALLLRDNAGTAEPPPAETPALASELTLATAVGGRVGLARDGIFLSAAKDGGVEFRSPHFREWELFARASAAELKPEWRPSSPMGGTELMHQSLQRRLGPALAGINLRLNSFDPAMADGRPVVVWIHNEVSGKYAWCNDPRAVDLVTAFVFVSHWQRQAFIDAFHLPPRKCLVLRNALELDGPAPNASWAGGRPWRLRCAYLSAPYRGLDVLLDGWDALRPANAELHIWSSRKLWGPRWADSEWEQALQARAAAMPNVVFHGIASNAEVRAALRDMHFLTYPSTFTETCCLSAVEAMAAGCRVIVPSLGALPETTAGFARVYPHTADKAEHAALFADVLADELRNPWQGDPSLIGLQQDYCRRFYDWATRAEEWRRLVADVTGRPVPARRPRKVPPARPGAARPPASPATP